MMASLNLCVHISRASTSLMVQKGADKRKDEDLMKGLKTRSKMLNLQILKCFQHLSKLIRTMMGSSPWKNMSRFSGSKLRDIYSHIYEKLHFNSFSEHGVNISKEEVALYFSSKVSFLKFLKICGDIRLWMKWINYRTGTETGE